MKRVTFGRTSLDRSFTVATALLVAALMGTTMLLVHSRYVSGLKQGLEARARSMARDVGALATPSLLAYNYPALQAAAEAAAKDHDVFYVVIHDKEGVVAGAAGDVQAATAADLAAKGEPDARKRLDEQRHVLEVSVPVEVEGVAEPWGTVRVALTTAAIADEIRRLDLGLLSLGFALAAVAVALGRYVARRITAPLLRLVEGTEALSAGDMEHRIPVTGPRELADLARAFNAMMDRVHEKARESWAFQEQLERLNATLEQQVKERTRALEESEAQYKTLVEHSPDIILIVQDGRVCFVNRPFVDTFGVRESEALSTDFHLRRIFESSSASMAEGRIAAWERGEPAAPVEVLGRDAAGNVRHLEMRGSRIEYRGRHAAECLLIDTTEAKRLREQLSNSEKLRALGELAGGVAHDFNNLLGAILGRVQILRRRPHDPDEDRELGVIEKAALDGRETVRRIQEFSRTRRDRRFTAVDLGEILRDVVEITRPRWKSEFEGRDVTIEVEADTPIVPPVLGNPAELREVFTNLVLNAVDAMPSGGSLRLACRREGQRVVATVADTGTGMTEEVQRQIFDPFFTTKGSRGMGLGMSVVYGILTRHGVEIDVATAVNRGTTFTLRFEVTDQALQPAGGDGAAMPQLLRPGRILVIDDEAEIVEIVKDVLSAEGHEVATALNGHAGLATARQTRFDLVFTDLGMPDMTGWEVAERVREHSPQSAVVLVTGWGATLDPDEVRRHGVEAVLNKPFEIDELVRIAASLLTRARTNQTS
ncbi:MAG TPA: response regulator [Candidatus Polarisedimenticolaceae bacterium]|nr:response regulator [Candidatus Polarisedimenticolaceae bacterium]